MRGTQDRIWQAGGAMIRLALLVPPVVALLVGVWFAAAAAGSTATGLDPANRGWFFLLAPPAQFGCTVMASTYLASVYFGVGSLPTFARSILHIYDPGDQQAGLLSRLAPVDRLSVLRKLVAAFVLAVWGTFAVFLAVPVQVLLTTWLLARPDLYSGPERVVIGIETAAAIAWLAYLVRGLWRHRSER